MLSVINQQFIKAAVNNRLDELKNLLNQGADIHSNDDDALRAAAYNGYLEVVKFLVLPDLGSVAITHGSSIHAVDDQALKFSAQRGHLEIVKFLVTQGANVHADNDYALRYSALKGHLENVKFLITNGANIHAENDYALRWSALRDHYDVWQVLSAFIQEEKLLVAASVSMPVLPSASTWVCGTAAASVALVAALGSTLFYVAG